MNKPNQCHASNAYLNHKNGVYKGWLQMSWNAIEENYGTLVNFVRNGKGLYDAVCSRVH
ncbi:MAG: hypothetical protein Q4E11_00005 [Corynebacterium sp.]|uniref:hypothetical protein n=1 Tax=Corynebacterium sp. TaxID=1720 RepID=UPI0026DB7F7D|nr:hypothetical protein [Corynebacterium sp.]MDO5028956.1 hypothetical protein [Corynebacterium sp.]